MKRKNANRVKVKRKVKKRMKAQNTIKRVPKKKWSQSKSRRSRVKTTNKLKYL